MTSELLHEQELTRPRKERREFQAEETAPAQNRPKLSARFSNTEVVGGLGKNNSCVPMATEKKLHK